MIPKFRVWDKINKEWLNLPVLLSTEGELYFRDPYGKAGRIVPRSRYEISLSTGLHDKNGKEIYEGDIVKMTRHIRVGTERGRRTRRSREYVSWGVYDDITFSGVVHIGTHEKSSFCAHIRTGQCESYDSYFWGEGKATDKPLRIDQKYTEALSPKEEYEVIGNKWESPELLND